MQRRAHLGLTAAVLCLGLQGSALHPVQPGFVGAFDWRMNDPLFGGFSAIELSPDGTRFIAVSDRGAMTQGRIDRAADGQITAVHADPVALLRSTGDAPLKPERADSEGLAWSGAGPAYVSFEGVARVLRYDVITGRAQSMPRSRMFEELQIAQPNTSLEALAIDDQDRLYTLPERSESKSAPFPVLRFDGAWAEVGVIRRDGPFRPVAADFGPDGRLYILERAFFGPGGFAARVRSFRLGPAGFDDERTELQTQPGVHDNLEGLSVWQDISGATRLTMVSDDNFQPFLNTEVVEYRLAR